ncbi:MAG: hypothetical protein ACR2PG_20225 [Hyphomicrobiaceae bacterium]
MARNIIKDEIYLIERRASWSDCCAGSLLATIVVLALLLLPAAI